MNIKYILHKIYSNNLNEQIIKFLCVGLISNFISFLTYIILINIMKISIFFSAISGQIFGVISNYFLNSRFVFRKKLDFQFKMVFLIYYLSAIYLVGKLIEVISNILDYRISWLLCVVVASIFNFIFLKFVTFKR